MFYAGCCQYYFQLKRLRELAGIVVDSDNLAMLPSNGNDVSGTSGDASAASASIHAGENEGEMADLKQNIDQVQELFYNNTYMVHRLLDVTFLSD